MLRRQLYVILLLCFALSFLISSFADLKMNLRDAFHNSRLLDAALNLTKSAQEASVRQVTFVDQYKQSLVCPSVDMFLLHSPLMRSIVDSIKSVEEVQVLLPDFHLDDIRGMEKIFMMSWCGQKEIFVEKGTQELLKVLAPNLPRMFAPVHEVEQLEAKCPVQQSCVLNAQGSHATVTRNIRNHIIRAHRNNELQENVDKCFPSHSKASGWKCRMCDYGKKVFKEPKDREEHVLSHHKDLFNMKKVNMLVDEALDNACTIVSKKIQRKCFPPKLASKVIEGNSDGEPSKSCESTPVRREDPKITSFFKSSKISNKKLKIKKEDLDKSDINGNNEDVIDNNVRLDIGNKCIGGHNETEEVLESRIKESSPEEVEEVLESSIIEEEQVKTTKRKKKRAPLWKRVTINNDSDDFI